MTVIVWDGKRLAADSYGICGDMRCVSDAVKVRQFVDKATQRTFLIGAAGRADDSVMFDRWLRGGMKPEEFPDIDSDGFGALVIRAHKDEKPQGWEFFGKKVGVQFDVTKPNVCGCAYPTAWAALDFGCNAIEAVKACMVRNVNIGGPVQFVCLPHYDAFVDCRGSSAIDSDDPEIIRCTLEHGHTTAHQFDESRFTLPRVKRGAPLGESVLGIVRSGDSAVPEVR